MEYDTPQNWESSPPPPKNNRKAVIIALGIAVLIIGAVLLYALVFREAPLYVPIPGFGTLPIGGDQAPPEAPTGLSAISTSPYSITIAWNPSPDSDVVGYYVYRNGERRDDLSGLRFTDITITASSSYTYTVSAYDAIDNESPASVPLLVIATDMFVPPEGDAIDVSTAPSGMLSVTNFYKTADKILLYGDVLIRETPDYMIQYTRFDSSFLISIIGGNPHLARALAESDFTDILGISQQDACKLKITIAVSRDVSEKLSKRYYRPSFCPDGTPF
ncbi:MAG: glycoside hydrolase family protein [Parcubacteria group bacterium Gr01-1014_29]|nr:MAG: glycoside hydrolase family protein [Parcubacteria group bacterium Gr01-1014_29]